MYRSTAIRSIIILSLLAVAGCQTSTSEKEDVDSQRLDMICATVKTYITAGLAGDKEALEEVCVPGRAVAEQAIEDLPQGKGVADLDIVMVYASDKAALAISSEIGDDRGRRGVGVFTVLLNAAARWQIDDIDFEDAEGLADEIERFMDAHSDVQVLRREPKAD